MVLHPPTHQMMPFDFNKLLGGTNIYGFASTRSGVMSHQGFAAGGHGNWRVGLHFLIGPTCVGKTALGIQWALANNAEILCADAPLVYKGMDIGTAKPTKEEQSQVKHHGIDLVDVKERFSVGDYIKVTQKIVSDVTSRGKNLLIVGGSGFYLKSFFEPVTDRIEADESIVATAAKIFETRGHDGLLAEMRRIGGEDLEGLDIKNPRRVIKALERCLASGKKYQQIRLEYLNQALPYFEYQKKITMILREKEDLQARIAKRTEAMLAGGLIEEVKTLKSKGIEGNPQAAAIIGYRETLEFLNEKINFEQLNTAIVQNTIKLVRKQRTFFKQLPVDKILNLASNKKGGVEELF